MWLFKKKPFPPPPQPRVVPPLRTFAVVWRDRTVEVEAHHYRRGNHGEVVFYRHVADVVLPTFWPTEGWYHHWEEVVVMEVAGYTMIRVMENLEPDNLTE